MHSVRLCWCGIVLAQCRCPGPKKREIGPKSQCMHTKKQIKEAKAKGPGHWVNGKTPYPMIVRAAGQT